MVLFEKPLQEIQQTLDRVKLDEDLFLLTQGLEKIQRQIRVILKSVQSVKNNYGKNLPTIIFFLIHRFLTPMEQARQQWVCKNWYQFSGSKIRSQVSGIQEIRQICLAGYTSSSSISHLLGYTKIAVFKNFFFWNGNFYDHCGRKQYIQQFYDYDEIRTSKHYICALKQRDADVYEILDYNYQQKYSWKSVAAYTDFAITDKAFYGVTAHTISICNFSGKLLQQLRTKDTKPAIHISHNENFMFLNNHRTIERSRYPWKEAKTWDFFPFDMVHAVCFSNTHIFARSFGQLIVYDLQGNVAFKMDNLLYITSMFFLDPYLCGFHEGTLRSYQIYFR